MRNLVIIGAICLLSGVIGGWWVTDSYKDAKHAAAMAKADKASAALLQEKTEEVMTAERRATELNNKLERVYAKKTRAIDADYAGDLVRIGSADGRLCDPGRRPGSDGAVPPPRAPSGAAGAANGCAGELSSEASRFLLSQAREADAVAAYAELCHAWVTGRN